MINFLQRSIDYIDQGLIVIDRQGKIKVYNQEAANIFGIDPRIGPGHEAGSIGKGDKVIIADNNLGKDDGNLSERDLEVIGINPKGIKQGQALVAIGEMEGPVGSAVYNSSTRKRDLIIKDNCYGIEIEASINFADKVLNIIINNKSYPITYSYAAGNIVILDSISGLVKFYQTRGYTARQEDIKSLLQGKTYISKGPRCKKPEVFNNHISFFHPDSDIINRLVAVANQKGREIKNQEAVINGIFTRCTISALREEDEIIGAILKVEDIHELKTVIKERDKALNSIQFLEERLYRQEKREEAFKDIIGISKSFIKAKSLAYKASESISTVLLMGESGTGKNLFARAIHNASRKKDGPFVYINCASIPQNLFESELFGYEKGSFTGALSTGKIGKLEIADGGTIFLDEVCELSLSFQAKLLQFLQNRTFTKLGGVEEKKVNVRFIFATNKDIETMIKEGKFREDFYFRINVFPIVLPSLYERKEDIPLLARTLIKKVCKKITKKTKEISPEAMELLLENEWKGNIRELENILERAVNISDSEYIMPEDLLGIKLKKITDQVVRVQGICTIKEAVAQTERKLIIQALKYTGGSRKKAMNILGIGKTAFYDKLKKYKIPRSR